MILLAILSALMLVLVVGARYGSELCQRAAFGVILVIVAYGAALAARGG